MGQEHHHDWPPHFPAKSGATGVTLKGNDHLPRPTRPRAPRQCSPLARRLHAWQDQREEELGRGGSEDHCHYSRHHPCE
ncbi:unnamed protein product [Linum trigynum]|uniref:Uncharacterized protein n=1 Tax=Linum trigynum TaxID=586398 RepID=A0AAV2EU95_9ROSI